MHLIKSELQSLPDSQQVIYDIISNPFVGDYCDLMIASNEDNGNLVAIRPATSVVANDNWRRTPNSQQHVEKALKQYISGNTQAFDNIIIELSGTKFQITIWHEISLIPYGQTISYSEIAIHAGKPQAIRAVASACGRNPVPLIIPCHRVIGKNNSLGGFAWGLPYKKMLLEMEGSLI